MANIFLDANYLIALSHPKNVKLSNALSQHNLFVSNLSIHIYCYVRWVKQPDPTLPKIIDQYNLVDLTSTILLKATSSPTSDLEDNIQLHSAVAADCDFFLTTDKQLLNLAYFGRLKLVSRMT